MDKTPLRAISEHYESERRSYTDCTAPAPASTAYRARGRQPAPTPKTLGPVMETRTPVPSHGDHRGIYGLLH